MQNKTKLLLWILIGWLCNALLWAQEFQPPSSQKKNKKERQVDPLLKHLETLEQNPLARMKSQSPQKGIISEIRLFGNKKIESEVLIRLLLTQVDQPLKPETVAQDIRKLFSTGIFKNIIVDQEEGQQESIIVSYKLEENPLIRSILFEGNEQIKSEELQEALTVKPRQIPNELKLKEQINLIQQFYRSKGLYLTTAHYKLNLIDSLNETYDLIFYIKEENKVFIESMEFSGNIHLSSDELKNVMMLKESHPLGMVTGQGTFSEEILSKRDVYALEMLYQQKGFLNVQIYQPQIKLTSDLNRVLIHIPINEGIQYHVGNIQISGDYVTDDAELVTKARSAGEFLLLESELKKLFVLKPGEVFNRTEIAQFISQISDLYASEGFAFVNLTPETQFQDDLIHIQIHVNAGEKVYYDRIEITGNYRTTDEVVRRELRIFEGDLYSSSLMRLSELKLNQLGHFSEVRFVTKPSTDKNKMNLEIRLKESRPGTLNAGLTSGTGGEGIGFKGQVQMNNFLGRGQTLAAIVEWSGSRRIFDFRFIDPYLFYLADYPFTFAFSAYDMERYMGDYTRKSTGFDLTLGTSLGRGFTRYTNPLSKGVSKEWLPYVPDLENLRFFLTYSAERVEIINNNLNLRLYDFHASQPGYNTAIKPTLEFDMRNNRLFPTAGYYLQLRSEFALSQLGSAGLSNIENQFRQNQPKTGIYAKDLSLLPALSNHYQRFGFNTRFYYNFDQWFWLKNWVFKFNLDMGYLNTFDGNIIAENYRIGGFNTIRGYYIQSIGPAISVAKESPFEPYHSFVLGGNKQLLLNLELEFPLVPLLQLNAIVFMDFANVYGKDQNWFYLNTPALPSWHQDLWLGLYKSAGFGLRWLSPLGLLRFEWGWPLTPRPALTPAAPILGDTGPVFEFSIGQSF